MRLSVSNRKARVQRLLKPADEAPKYVNPYFQKPVEKPTSRFKQWLKKDGWAFIIAGILVAGGLGFFLMRHQYFMISQVTVNGTQRISAEEVQAVIQDFMQLKRLGFIQQNTYWTLDSQRVEIYVKQRFHNNLALENVYANKDFPHTINVQIKERVPSMNWGNGGVWYILDPQGVIAQAYAPQQPLDTSLPTIIDLNQTPVEISQQLVSPEYVDFIRTLHGNFTVETGLAIEQFEVPVLTCQEKQFVAEEEIQQQLDEAVNEETKQKIRQVQERFKSGEIDIDTSLELLQEIKTKEQPAAETEATDTVLAFKARYVATACDLVAVLNDVVIKTTGDTGGFWVIFDSSQDLDTQIGNLNTVIAEKVTNPLAVQYIDVRFADRAYIK